MNEISLNIILPMIKVEAFMKSRANFTTYHLIAAQNAAAIAKEIENKYKSEAPSSEERDFHLSQVSTALICSVAALESNINEYIVDHEKQIDKVPVISDPKVLKKYKFSNDLLSSQLLGSTTIIFKYDIIWFLKKKSLLPEHRQKQDIRYLAKLRNALTHFTPEWDNALSKHIDLEKDKKNRFTLNPFYPPGGLFFPYRCLSASCAQWSYRVSKQFIDFINLNVR